MPTGRRRLKDANLYREFESLPLRHSVCRPGDSPQQLSVLPRPSVSASDRLFSRAGDRREPVSSTTKVPSFDEMMWPTLEPVAAPSNRCRDEIADGTRASSK